MNKPVEVKKYSGETVQFDRDKLISSLTNAGSGIELANDITQEVEKRLFDGISTKTIYQMAFKRLKKSRRTSASKYKIKKAIMELGPSGFPFEQFVSHIFNSDGYRTEVGVIMQGNCVAHEVDVVARKDNLCHISECKYHNSQKKVSDVKVPLYIDSRFRDIMARIKAEKGNGTIYKGWIFTNTRFTSDAIKYANCAGIQLISWDYPSGKSLKDRIRNSGLMPITALTTLTRREKTAILDKGIVLCRELFKQKNVLAEVGVARTRLSRVLEDLEELCESKS
jgi:hypothetical protein